jgi:hypothetical protein
MGRWPSANNMSKDNNVKNIGPRRIVLKGQYTLHWHPYSYSFGPLSLWVRTYLSNLISILPWRGRQHSQRFTRLIQYGRDLMNPSINAQLALTNSDVRDVWLNATGQRSTVIQSRHQLHDLFAGCSITTVFLGSIFTPRQLEVQWYIIRPEFGSFCVTRKWDQGPLNRDSITGVTHQKKITFILYIYLFYLCLFIGGRK